MIKRYAAAALAAAVAIAAAWWAVTGRGAKSTGPDALQSAGAGYQGFIGGVLEPPRAAPDFTLVDQHGSAYTLSEQRGDIVVLFFGYTTCPDVCPTTLVQYRRIKGLLGDDAARVQFVFVTVDPERDTRERLGEYLSHFDSEFVGLTGESEALQAVWRAYGVYVERVDAPNSQVGYWVNHSSVSYVIDTKGDLRLIHLYNTPSEDVVHDLALLLAEAKAA